MNGTDPLSARRALVVGASAGAVDALLQILPPLPPDYPLGVALVVHIPPDSPSALASLLAARCRIRVKEAEDKEPLLPGVVYVAPPNYHMLVEPTLVLSLSSEEAVHYSRPAIDVLFETAADAYGNSLAGLVLTGGNADGANGLRAIHHGGGVALVQAPETAVHPEMPIAALRACPSARTVPLPELAAVVKDELPRLLS